MGKWFDIQNKAKDTADVYIYSEVGGYDVNAKSFIDELKEIKDKDINVHINSLGGSVFDGLAIYNALKNHAHKVTTKVEGICASISSVIAMAGDTIEMAENSLLMIHNPFAMSGGDANELRKTANILDKIRNEIADIYASRSKHDAEHYINLMDVESWFNSKESLELGLINGITSPIAIKNEYDISKFSNITTEKINQVINHKNNLVMAENTQNKVVENNNENPTNDATLIGKIKSMLGVNPTNEHEEGHDESVAEETDWAKTYEEMKDKVDNLEKAVHEIEVAMGMKDDEIENKSKELESANAEIQNKSEEIAKLKATKTDVVAKNEETKIGSEKTVDPNMAFFNAMVKSIQRIA